MAAQKKGISRFAEENGRAHTVCGRRFRPPAGGMPVNGTFGPPSAPYPAHRHKQKPAFLWGIGRKGPAGRVQCFRRGVPAAAVPRLYFHHGIPAAFFTEEHRFDKSSSASDGKCSAESSEPPQSLSAGVRSWFIWVPFSIIVPLLPQKNGFPGEKENTLSVAFRA